METKDIIKELRKKRGYSAQQVADGCDMSLGVYKKYESGERGVGVPALSKLADFYKVSTDYLLGRDNGDQAALDELAGQFNMSLLEKKIVENYLNLDEKMRGDLMDFLARTVKEVEAESAAADKSQTAPVPQVTLTPQSTLDPQAKPESQPEEDEGELTLIAARSFDKNDKQPGKLRLKKRPGAGSIFDMPDYKGD